MGFLEAVDWSKFGTLKPALVQLLGMDIHNKEPQPTQMDRWDRSSDQVDRQKYRYTISYNNNNEYV